MNLRSKSTGSFFAEKSEAIKTEPILACSNLHRYLGTGEGRVHAVRGVSFDLEARQSCAIVGPSGCGKSSLLYSLGLLDRPDAGSIRVRGREFSEESDEVRTRARCEEIGFVFQFHFLLSEFSAFENVMLPMMRKGKLSSAEMRDRAHFLLGQVGLMEKAKRRANHLSGGEQQRVAIARSLANAPAVVLADEPTGNLDAANAERVVDLLLAVADEEGRSVVIVTHNQEIAQRCDRELAMVDGRFADE